MFFSCSLIQKQLYRNHNMNIASRCHWRRLCFNYDIEIQGLASILSQSNNVNRIWRRYCFGQSKVYWGKVNLGYYQKLISYYTLLHLSCLFLFVTPLEMARNNHSWFSRWYRKPISKELFRVHTIYLILQNHLSRQL